MSYTAFTITRHKKEKGVFRIVSSHDSGDGWTGSGNFLDLYPVSGMLVAVGALNQRPKAIFRDLDHCCAALEKEYGIKPTVSI